MSDWKHYYQNFRCLSTLKDVLSNLEASSIADEQTIIVVSHVNVDPDDSNLIVALKKSVLVSIAIMGSEDNDNA